jgi:hypothetical protein
VEGADFDFLADGVFGGDAMAHFLSGFVGEGDAENFFGRHLPQQKLADARGDRGSFSAAGAGDDESAAFKMLGDFFLLGVEGHAACILAWSAIRARSYTRASKLIQPRIFIHKLTRIFTTFQRPPLKALFENECNNL